MTLIVRRLCCSYVAVAPRLSSPCSTSAKQNLFKPCLKYYKWRLPLDDKKQLPAADRVLYHLQSVYGATEDQCRMLIRSPTLATLPQRNILDTITALKENHIPLHQLLRIPWILTIEKNELQNRLKLLLMGPDMFLTPTDCAGFCCYCHESIRKFHASFYKESSEIEGYRNRVYYMAHRLKVMVPELTEALAPPKSFLVMSIWRMSLVMKLVEEFEVPGEMILRDPWIFYPGLHFSAVDAKKKLPQNRKKSAKAGASNLEEKILHLADKLDIHVGLLRAHWRDRKFKIILSKRGFVRTNILLDEGYTLGDILMNIRALQCSEKRLTERLSVLRRANHKTMIMGALYESDQKFNDYCKKIVFAPCLLDQLYDQAESEETDVINSNQSLPPKKWTYKDYVVEK